MARMIGRTGSWMWWVLGALCALLFGPRAAAGEMEIISPPIEEGEVAPRVSRQVATPEQKKAAEKLVDDYLAPVAPAEPTDEQKATIDAALKDLAAADFAKREAASAALIKIGPAALTALRAAAQDKDPEVVTRAEAAVTEIENSARQAIAEELRKNPAAVMTVLRRQNEARTAQFAAMREAEEARKAGKVDEADVKGAAAKAAREKSVALSALMATVFPGGSWPGPQPIYNIMPPVAVD